MRFLVETVAVLVSVVLAGCNVEVGEGRIPPVTYDAYVTLPSEQARTGVADLAYHTDWGDDVELHLGARTTASVTREIEFYSAGEARLFKDQLDGHTIERIDLDVKQLTLLDAESEALVADDIHAAVQVNHVVLGGVGFVGRVALGDQTRKQVVSAIEEERALVLSVGLTVDCSQTQLLALPTFVRVTVIVQPILTVKIF